MQPAFDLRHEVPWIPVRRLDGARDVLALQPLLEQAHLIDEVTGVPAAWAALMRFLPSVLALVAREDPNADFETFATEGIPSALIDAALEKVAAHLWLIHPETPFMQDPRLLLPEKLDTNSTEWLHLTTPAASSKAWWGKPGDGVHPDAGSPARVALGLVTSWFFSPGVGGQAKGFYADAPEDGWRPRGTVSFRNHGLRAFWRGWTLASTLLANTMEVHVRHGARRGGANLPLWAITGEITPAAGPLTAATWTGSAYRLTHDGERFTGVHSGGRRIPGIAGPTEERATQVRVIEKGLWRSDPTIPRAAVVKAGEETGDVRPIRSLHPSASTVQWAAEWYAADERRAAARSMEPGLVEVAASDVFAIRLEGQATAPEIAYLSRVGEASTVADPSARTRLISLSALVMTPVRKTLYSGLVKALGAEAAKPLHDKLYAAFCRHAEPILDDIIHAPEFRREDAARFAAAASTAFEQFLASYMTSRTLGAGPQNEGIASAQAFVRARSRRAVREVRV